MLKGVFLCHLRFNHYVLFKNGLIFRAQMYESDFGGFGIVIFVKCLIEFDTRKKWHLLVVDAKTESMELLINVIWLTFIQAFGF